MFKGPISGGSINYRFSTPIPPWAKELSCKARLMDSSARFVGAAQSTKEVGSASGMSQERALKDWSDGLSSGK